MYANISIGAQVNLKAIVNKTCTCVRVHTYLTPAYTTNVVAERGSGYPDS